MHYRIRAILLVSLRLFLYVQIYILFERESSLLPDYSMIKPLSHPYTNRDVTQSTSLFLEQNVCVFVQSTIFVIMY